MSGAGSGESGAGTELEQVLRALDAVSARALREFHGQVAAAWREQDARLQHALQERQDMRLRVENFFQSPAPTNERRRF